jgi:hypothetical protein
MNEWDDPPCIGITQVFTREHPSAAIKLMTS